MELIEDVLLLNAFPFLAAVYLFWLGFKRIEVKRMQDETGVAVDGFVTRWEMHRKKKNIYYEIHVTANGTSYKILTESSSGSKYKKREDIRLLVDQHTLPSDEPEKKPTLTEMLSGKVDKNSLAALRHVDERALEVVKQFDEESDYIPKMFRPKPEKPDWTKLPVLWEERVTTAKIILAFAGAFFFSMLVVFITCMILV